jgi:DNA-binding NarL/FixJ family response regulator
MGKEAGVTAIDRASMAGIEERLDRIVHLLTAIVTKDMSRKDAVLTLTASGLAPKEIASILGLTGNQVSVVLYDAKHAAAKQAKVPNSPKAKAQPRGD